MAAGMIKVMLVGTLGKDPEVRFAASGTPVCTLRVACTEKAKNKSGEWEDHTEWVNVVAFGKTAENAGQYLAKGRQVFAEGRLRTREWEDKDKNKRSITEVVASNVLFLGGKGEQHAESPEPAAAKKAQRPSDDDEPLPF